MCDSRDGSLYIVFVSIFEHINAQSSLKKDIEMMSYVVKQFKPSISNNFCFPAKIAVITCPFAI